MVWRSASLLGPGMWKGRGGGEAPAPKGNRLWLHSCGGGGRGVSVWFSGISFMLWKLACAVRGSGEGSQAGGRGCLLERFLPSHWLLPCVEGKIKHQMRLAGAWANGAGQPSSRCAQLFSPTPQPESWARRPLSAALWVSGPQVSGLRRLASTFPTVTTTLH